MILDTMMVQMEQFDEGQATTFEKSRGLNPVVKIVTTTLSPTTIMMATTCDYNKNLTVEIRWSQADLTASVALSRKPGGRARLLLVAKQ